MTPKGDPLPADWYRLRFRVWDQAGNRASAPGVTVRVSDRPLVEATGTVTVPPTGTHTTSGVAAVQRAAPSTARGQDGRESATVGQNETQPVPCGTVAPSEIYPDRGAMSFRSADTCGGTFHRPSVAAAGGSLAFDTLTPEVAPRGLATTQLTMRGRPTTAGETDTARLFSRGQSWFYYVTNPDATSAPDTAETLTTAPAKGYPWEPPYGGRYTRAVDWSIATVGSDSFDVADVTVRYTYLTPQTS